MINTPLARWVRSVAIATILTSIMLAVLIIFAEEIPALKNWLKATFTHHWLGKGALALILFAVSAVLLRLKRDTPSLATYILIEAIVVALSTAAIAGFFLMHVLKVI